MASRCIAMCQTQITSTCSFLRASMMRTALRGGLGCCVVLLQMTFAPAVNAQTPVAGQPTSFPKPIQDQTFATQLPGGQPGARLPGQPQLQSAQAFERVGKQFFPSRPTGRTTLQRSEESPWLQRLLRPRNQTGPESTQPVQQSQQQRTSRAQADNQVRQIQFPRTGPVAQPYPVPEGRSAAFKQPEAKPGYQAGSRYDTRSAQQAPSTQRIVNGQQRPTQLDVKPLARPNSNGAAKRYTDLVQAPSATQTNRAQSSQRTPRIGIGSLPDYRPVAPTVQRLAADSSRRTQVAAQTTASPDISGLKPRTDSNARTSRRTESLVTTGTGVPPQNRAPKVPRTPVPQNPVVKKEVKTTQAPTAQLSSNEETKPAKANRRSAILNRPAKVGAEAEKTSQRVTPQETATKPSGVQPQVAENKLAPPQVVADEPEASRAKIPAQLVNTPMAESAARKEAHSPPPALDAKEAVAAKPEIQTKAKLTPKPEEPDESKTVRTPNIPLPTLPAAPAKQTEVATDEQSNAIPNLPPASEALTRRPVVSKAAEADAQAVAKVKSTAVETNAKPVVQNPSVQPSTSKPTAEAVAKRMPPVTRDATESVTSTDASSNSTSSAAGNYSQVSNRTLLDTGLANRRPLNPMGAANFRTEYRASPDQRLSTESPSLRVVLNGPETLDVGSLGNYEIVVLNQDRINLEGLVLRLDVPKDVAVQPMQPQTGEVDSERAPDGATLMTWGIPTLRAGQIARAPVQMVAKRSSNFPIGLEWTLIPVSQTANINVVSPKLDISIEGAGEVVFGETNVYRLRLRNRGQAVARNVVVQVNAEDYGSTSSNVGNLPPGAEEILEVELDFEQRGEIQLNATAQSSNNIGAAAETRVIVRQAVLQAEMSAPQIVFHGKDVEYSVRVLNTGDAASKSTAARLRLPVAAQPTTLPYGAKQQGDSLVWAMEPIAPGGERTYRFRLSLPTEGANKVAFECRSTSTSTVTAAATTLVEAIADLILLVNDPIAPAPLGAEVAYELNLTNRGSKAARNVSVVAQFSQGIEPTRGSGKGYRVVPGQVFFDPIASVEPGQSVKLLVYAVAEKPGMHRFRAEVRNDEEGIRLVQEESTRYLESIQSRPAQGRETRMASPPNQSSLR
jgi:hypothetical protein